ncbi:uncharacterized protein LOC113464976 [Ceratina calcarata]|uniref:Uncharacterized protein LOC113464976 n=1 Tax=Ceratina calcarata TaxID=156304 RepID=A0AAJ7S998_9HYME|nr:uncharacterized protein LOC113464976 [Ceratina calcarata]
MHGTTDVNTATSLYTSYALQQTSVQCLVRDGAGYGRGGSSGRTPIQVNRSILIKKSKIAEHSSSSLLIRIINGSAKCGKSGISLSLYSRDQDFYQSINKRIE